MWSCLRNLKISKMIRRVPPRSQSVSSTKMTWLTHNGWAKLISVVNCRVKLAISQKEPTILTFSCLMITPSILLRSHSNSVSSWISLTLPDWWVLKIWRITSTGTAIRWVSTRCFSSSKFWWTKNDTTRRRSPRILQNLPMNLLPKNNWEEKKRREPQKKKRKELHKKKKRGKELQKRRKNSDD